MDDALQFLFTLQDYDIRKLAVQRDIQNIPARNQSIDQEIQKIQQEIQKIQKNLIEQKKAIREQEQLLIALEKTLEQDRYQLPLTKNLIAHQTLDKKINQTESQIAQIEDKTLQMLVDMETFEHEAEKDIAQLESAIKEKSDQKIATDPLLERAESIDQKISTIREILTKESPEWLNLYDKTRRSTKRVPCIVQNQGNQTNCASCHLKQSKITPQLLDGTKFYICESCGCVILLSENNVQIEEDDEKTEPELDSLGYRKIRYYRRKR